MSPIQKLVIALIDTGRFATLQEVEDIITHVAQASFSTRLLKINQSFRQDLATSGIELPDEYLSSLEIHLLKRIYVEQQWPLGTTVAQYVADLHQAVCEPNCEIYTYRWRGEAFVSFLALSHHQRTVQVRNPQPFIFVAYSVDYDTIKTGFQASSAAAIFTPYFEQITRHR